MKPVRRAALYGAVIVANAAVQAVLVAVAPRQPLDAVALVLALLSGIVLLAASIASWGIGVGRLPRRLVLLGIGSGIVVALLAVAAPYLIPLAVAASCPVLASAGLRRAVADMRRHPWRVTGLLVLTIVAVALAFVLAMLLGLLVTGAPAAAIEWLVVGAGGVALIEAWVRVVRRQP